MNAAAISERYAATSSLAAAESRLV